MLKPFLKRELLEVGLDEVGRGCLGGRVYAAAVIWSPFKEDYESYYDISILNKIKDSKKIPKKQIPILKRYIEENAVDFSIGWSEPEEIDKINIRNASMLAMHRALDKLNIDPDHIIIDGNYFKEYNEIPYKCIIKGDNKYLSIASASILAKYYRDDYILNLVDKFPNLDLYYDWSNNKSYGTKKHIEGIKKNGISLFHRKTFGICKKKNVVNN